MGVRERQKEREKLSPSSPRSLLHLSFFPGSGPRNFPRKAAVLAHSSPPPPQQRAFPFSGSGVDGGVESRRFFVAFLNYHFNGAGGKEGREEGTATVGGGDVEGKVGREQLYRFSTAARRRHEQVCACAAPSAADVALCASAIAFPSAPTDGRSALLSATLLVSSEIRRVHCCCLLSPPLPPLLGPLPPRSDRCAERSAQGGAPRCPS